MSMPELPEVATCANVLHDLIGGKIITDIVAGEKGVYRSGGPKKLDFKGVTFPQKIVRIFHRGKKIVFQLKKGFMVSFLGMEGRWILEEGKHTCIILCLDKGNIYFDDTRHFGVLLFATEPEDYEAIFKDVGLDLLNDRALITAETWRETLSSSRLKNKEIGDFLLEQKYFAGVGNYLKSEILYRTRISPYRTLGTLSEREMERLRRKTFLTIDESYAAGGLTIATYRNPLDEMGTYTVRVYGLDEDSKGNIVERVVLKDGRTTYWVPAVQK